MATLSRTNVFQVQIKSQNNQNFHRKDNGVLEGEGVHGVYKYHRNQNI